MRPRISLPFLFALTTIASLAHGQNATTPDQLVTDPPTLHALGFAWFIQGDDNRDCTVTMRFRESGGSDWQDAMPLFRVENALISGDVHPGNLLAGSIFGLTADTEYEVELTLSDPDGGSDQQTVAAYTRAVPPPTDSSAPKFVAPGSGGGSGTQGDPYLGLAAADAAAQPGDVFVLTAGTYQGHSFGSDGSAGLPITYRGEDRDTVVVDGGSTDAIVIGLGSRQHLVLENFTLRNAQRAISGADTENIVIRHLLMDNIGRFNPDRDPFAIYLSGDSKNAYVCDNTLTGPVDWQSEEYGPDSYGIKVNGSGHVVCYNAVSAFWDNIGMAYGDGVHSISVDIYRNVLLDASDDSIETDYAQRNIRVYRNQLANSLKGISCQPVYGGPVYLLRNEMFNTRSSPYKFHVNPSGMLILHNSTAAFERAFAGGEWSNAVFRNNLFYGSSGYAMETVGALEDFDYNGWAPQQTPVLKFNDIRYDTINADCGNSSNVDDWCAQTGHSEHAIEISRADWNDVPEPAAYTIHPTPGDWDFELADGSGAIDSAELMPNLNDGFVGNGPDRGALERGAPRPHYGPRADWEDPGSGTGGSGAAAGAGGSGADGTGANGSGANGTGGSDAAGAATDDDGGCGCRLTPTSGLAAPWLFALGWIVARSRRRWPASCRPESRPGRQ